MKWAIARPSAASRVSSSAAACAARAGRGPSVPALRYARRASTGNSARSAVQSTNGENTPMPSAGGQGPLWEPSKERRDSAEMTRFAAWAARRNDATFADYEALRRWSVERLEDFWAAMWEYAGVRASRPYERVLDSRRMPGARWFEGARLNYAENLLAGPAGGPGRDPGSGAVLHGSQLRELSELTWGELSAQVAAAAAGLRSLGAGGGDRRGALMPH